MWFDTMLLLYLEVQPLSVLSVPYLISIIVFLIKENFKKALVDKKVTWQGFQRHVIL